MNTVISKTRSFVESEEGPTAVEYATMLALLIVACVNIVTALGRSTCGTFSKVNSSVS